MIWAALSLAVVAGVLTRALVYDRVRTATAHQSNMFGLLVFCVLACLVIAYGN